MSTVDKVKGLTSRIPDLELLGTEEATKNALVMPFIAALGYDVFDPAEVVPEFTADVGIKKGEKVDYAIKRCDEVIMLIECKKATEPLNDGHLNQLYRYFSVTCARIGILTNGVVFRFYSDLEERNKMDAIPFLEMDLSDLREGDLKELAKLSKDAFDLDDMLSTASDLKYTGIIRRTLERQFEAPDEDLVKFFFGVANPQGRFGKNAREQFVRLVRKALAEAVTDRVSLRLRAALERENEVETEPADGEPQAASDGDPTVGRDGIVTTEEELQGYRIVKAIVCNVAPPQRIAYRDSKTYLGVLFDDNNRKPICRLWFNSRQKYIGLFDEAKKETRHRLESLEQLYEFADYLRDTARRYCEPAPSAE